MATQAYTTLNDPLARPGPGFGTSASGISGGRIVGTYYDRNLIQHGFMYSNGAFTTIDDPDATMGTTTGGDTIIGGIEGDTIVGAYSDDGYYFHGFEAVLPEPASTTLVCFACVLLLRRRPHPPHKRP